MSRHQDHRDFASTYPARAIELALQRITERHDVPEPIQSILAACLLPFGFGRGLQRLVLLLTLASLSLMRSTTEACRGLLLGPARAETGRSRSPRPAGSLPLYPMCTTSVIATAAAGRLPAETGSDLVCAALAAPSGVLVLTSTALRCAGTGPGAAPLWELPLAQLLLVQQRGRELHLLALSSSVGSHDSVETRKLALHSDDDAARVHEVLRLAGLNARGAVLPPSHPVPQFRMTVFELLG